MDIFIWSLRCIVFDLVTEDINHKFLVNLIFWFYSLWWIGHLICEDYNMTTKMVLFFKKKKFFFKKKNHESGDL